MGEVHKARDTRLDRTVAIKVLSSHLSTSPEFRQRFEREAKAISQLSHPNICTLYDVGREGEVEYLVMEFLEGDTLLERLAKGPLPLEQTLRYGSQIADALDKAHRQAIVHRDLKPGNVMLTKTGVKLLDFGLAKAMAGADPEQTTSTTQANVTEKGTVLGTFQYIAPELLEGKDAEGRSDIFALGAVLYEMATGKKAFTGSTQASLISAILRDEPQPISQVEPAAPPALDHVVRTCLAKDADDRWQSAGDVAKELRWIAENSLSGARAAPVTRRRRRREAVAWALAGLLTLGVLFLANELRRTTRRPAPRPVYSFLVAPEHTAFRMTGDDAAPVVLSPDGRRAVFGAGGRLWVQSLETGITSLLPSKSGGTFPFWSPDSRSIAFFADGKLKTTDASGGPVQDVCDAANPRGGAWNAQGVISFSPAIRTGLFRVEASVGKPTPLTVPDGSKSTTHRWPEFLADSRHFIYLAANHNVPRSEETAIYLGDLDGKE